MFAIVMLYLAGIGLGGAGLSYLSETGGYYASESDADRYMVHGYVCLALGTTLFLVASILAFIVGSTKTAVQDDLVPEPAPKK